MDKRTQLLEVLNQSEQPITGIELQSILGVSRRSVVSYVAALNRRDESLILSSNRGYSMGGRLARGRSSNAHLMRTDSRRTGRTGRTT